MTTEPNRLSPLVIDAFPAFRVAPHGSGAGRWWDVTCLTCERAGLPWSARCDTPQAVVAVLTDHRGPCRPPCAV